MSTAMTEFVISGNTSINSLLQSAWGIQSQCNDFMIREANEFKIRFDAEKHSLIFKTDDNNSGVVKEYALTQYAMGQLCSKLEIPVRYIDNCYQKGQLDLAGENINTWLSEYGKDLFIRTYKDTIRGILSNRYMTLDVPHIIEAVQDNLKGYQFDIKGSYLTPERFHARVVNREQILTSEDLFAGLQIDSSDVGRSTLTVSFFIYKQVCTNGLIMPVRGGALFSQRHIGRHEDEVSEFRKGFRTAMERIPDLVSEYKGIILNSKSKKLPLESVTNHDYLREKVAKEIGLSKESVDKVFEIREEKYPATEWGLINAITEVAQDYTLERRLEIEKLAGNMLMKVA